MRSDYQNFLIGKTRREIATGIEPSSMPAHMFDFQRACTEFALRQGRSAIFLDTGLGKTIIELEFGKQVGQALDAPILHLSPLAVAQQIEQEAHRFGYEARVIRDQTQVAKGINICNYDRLDRLEPSAFGGVILDESSILKSFMGATTQQLIAAFSETPFKLCATATPAPNDYTELGNHVEFLGIMARAEMLARWFINDAGRSNTWRLKHYAQTDFWDWMASWSRMAESPVDLGFDGSRFVLPPIEIIRSKTIGRARPPTVKLEGFFANAVSATNLHYTKRYTTEARADAAASLVKADPGNWVVWCDTDYEADALVARLPNAIEVRGSQAIDKKERKLRAFSAGTGLDIITKPRIAGFGLNWQHSHKMIFVGRSFSYELWYQAVRRCWRFGQKHPVKVHIIVAEGEDQIGDVIERKSEDHITMKREMAAAMRRHIHGDQQKVVPYHPTYEGKLPTWLR